jgi:hypothetical protein
MMHTVTATLKPEGGHTPCQWAARDSESDIMIRDWAGLGPPGRDRLTGADSHGASRPGPVAGHAPRPPTVRAPTASMPGPDPDPAAVTMRVAVPIAGVAARPLWPWWTLGAAKGPGRRVPVVRPG